MGVLKSTRLAPARLLILTLFFSIASCQPSNLALTALPTSQPSLTSQRLPTVQIATGTPERISSFGKYAGYSTEQYNGWARSSQYISMRDGTRLAVDITRPTLDGKLVQFPFPVVWTLQRYHRAQTDTNGDALSMVDGWPELQTLMKHGYIFVAVDARGTGASFGSYTTLFSEDETRDSYDVTEWLAAQTWSNGSIGMWGGSYLGMTQYMAASQKPPHLKALFPMISGFDLYDIIYPGGIFLRNFVDGWGASVYQLDMTQPAPPVDDDPNGNLLRQAVAQHANNWDIREGTRKEKYRSFERVSLYTSSSPSTYIPQVNESKIPIYHMGGWMDGFARDTLLWYANVTNPEKLLVGPWSHNPGKNEIGTAFHTVGGIEMLRWFDFWLKGIDNGILREEPIHYATISASGQWEWKSARQWPPENVQTETFSFVSGDKGGEMVNQQSTQDPEFDLLPANEHATTGKGSRWLNILGAPLDYGNISINNSLGLMYTSEALTSDLTITGSPVVTLYIASSTPNLDLHITLEDVDPQGSARYVTEGSLRASHRALSAPPYNRLGLPYHRSFLSDEENLLPGVPTEMVLDLLPTSTLFQKGHALRITITTADADNFANLTYAGTPKFQIFHNPHYNSRILIPIEKGITP